MTEVLKHNDDKQKYTQDTLASMNTSKMSAGEPTCILSDASRCIEHAGLQGKHLPGCA